MKTSTVTPEQRAARLALIREQTEAATAALNLACLRRKRERAARKVTSRTVGHVGVDSGRIEIGDCGAVALRLRTRHGDGIYPVTQVKVAGQIRGYFISCDGSDAWRVSDLVKVSPANTVDYHADVDAA
jgi:hypothetical protein